MDFLKLCEHQEYSKQAIKDFKEALNFAKIILDHKKRLSGESYYQHNIKVAEILVENKSEPEIIVTSILHGLLADISKETIQERFGKEI
ncbi:bifunctional (p)ppGpp synthetase/guanosine-3',5'-bis(diphosphate) 3'-pyrophosphohydrolase, partial [Candidatus Woesearchaeota archaeon]|nr:bifunctional (p)ppGpp synthetase/guanosine-3',5'-bis(diphosphate) 3'-pyrophosphohydrolase [Candidatus Woesearchaeota archaeon]